MPIVRLDPRWGILGHLYLTVLCKFKQTACVLCFGKALWADSLKKPAGVIDGCEADEIQLREGVQYCFGREYSVSVKFKAFASDWHRKIQSAAGTQHSLQRCHGSKGRTGIDRVAVPAEAKVFISMEA